MDNQRQNPTTLGEAIRLGYALPPGSYASNHPVWVMQMPRVPDIGYRAPTPLTPQEQAFADYMLRVAMSGGIRGGGRAAGGGGGGGGQARKQEQPAQAQIPKAPPMAVSHTPFVASPMAVSHTPFVAPALASAHAPVVTPALASAHAPVTPAATPPVDIDAYVARALASRGPANNLADATAQATAIPPRSRRQVASAQPAATPAVTTPSRLRRRAASAQPAALTTTPTVAAPPVNVDEYVAQTLASRGPANVAALPENIEAYVAQMLTPRSPANALIDAASRTALSSPQATDITQTLAPRSAADVFTDATALPSTVGTLRSVIPRHLPVEDQIAVTDIISQVAYDPSLTDTQRLSLMTQLLQYQLLPGQLETLFQFAANPH